MSSELKTLSYWLQCVRQGAHDFDVGGGICTRCKATRGSKTLAEVIREVAAKHPNSIAAQILSKRARR